MNYKPLAVWFITMAVILALRVISDSPSAVVADTGHLLVETPTLEPPPPTATWSGMLFIPFGARGEATPPPTATAMPTPPICIFPEPTTPGITIVEGTWVQINDGEWIVHNRAGDSRLVIRFAEAQLISLWSVDNERRGDDARPAVAALDNNVRVELPWTGDMQVVPAPGGPWTTLGITVTAATRDSPGVRWCSWQ